VERYLAVDGRHVDPQHCGKDHRGSAFHNLWHTICGC
jgi:hypothetical protein